MSDEPILVPETRASKRKRKTIAFTKGDRPSADQRRPKEAEPSSDSSEKVTQVQLEKLIYAKHKLKEAREKYDEIRGEIIELLGAGKEIEFGVHTARLSVCEGCKATGSRCSQAKLIFG